jgi:hypothetical protein
MDNNISLTGYFIFASWQHLLEFILAQTQTRKLSLFYGWVRY